MSPKNIVAVIAMLLCVSLLAGCGTAQEKSLTELPAETELSGPAAESEELTETSIIVTEFMEKNKALIRDEDGDFSDWIELYNAGNESVPLKGWRISDDPEQKGWKFPDVSIEPGEFMLVFASNKEKEGGTELHADFAISGDEGVYLKNPDGEIVFEALCGD